MLKDSLKKIFFICSIAYICTACNAVKRVGDKEHLLVENSFVVNGKTTTSEALSKLSFQKTNSRILGIPVRLHIYNFARPNKDSIFESWLNKRPKRRERLIKKFSKKQLNQIKKSSLGFNSWLKNTGEAPSILDSIKIQPLLRGGRRAARQVRARRGHLRARRVPRRDHGVPRGGRRPGGGDHPGRGLPRDRRPRGAPRRTPPRVPDRAPRGEPHRRPVTLALTFRSKNIFTVFIKLRTCCI